jgi:hypothetical protein
MPCTTPYGRPVGEGYLVRFANALTRLVTSLGDDPGQPITLSRTWLAENGF